MTNQDLKGMVVDVYSSDHSSSNLGISHFHNSVLLIGEGIPKIFEAGNLPIVELRERKIPGGGNYLFAAPYLCDRSMAGGAFIWSTDSRFRQDISERPVPLHDRFENACLLNSEYLEITKAHPNAFSYHKKENLKFNAIHALNQAIQFATFNRENLSKEEVLGILISQWAKWDVSRLQDIASAAFEDSNASQLAKTIIEFDFEDFDLEGFGSN